MSKSSCTALSCQHGSIFCAGVRGTGRQVCPPLLQPQGGAICSSLSATCIWWQCFTSPSRKQCKEELLKMPGRKRRRKGLWMAQSRRQVIVTEMPFWGFKGLNTAFPAKLKAISVNFPEQFKWEKGNGGTERIQHFDSSLLTVSLLLTLLLSAFVSWYILVLGNVI